MNFTATVSPSSPSTVVVTGELDLASMPVLQRLVTVLTRPAGTELVLDLSGVAFLDCTGLAALIRARRLTAARGGTLRMARPSAAVSRLTALTGTGDLLVGAVGSSSRRS
jgi:anti-sigma B factor antagonist